MLILWPLLLRIQYRRWRARSAARAWTAELDAIKADLGASGELWEMIGQWTAADPLNGQEFLVLFRKHHRRGHAAPISRFVLAADEFAQSREHRTAGSSQHKSIGRAVREYASLDSAKAVLILAIMPNLRAPLQKG